MSSLDISQLLANYGSLAGAVAVVSTLVYLATQIKQNTLSVRASAYQSWVSANVEINMGMSNPTQSEIVATGDVDASKLTEPTASAFFMIHMALFQMGQSTDFLYRAGAMDEELWKAEMNRVAGLLRFPGVRQMWDAGAKTQLAPSFVRHLEALDSDITLVHWSPEQGFYDFSRGGRE